MYNKLKHLKIQTQNQLLQEVVYLILLGIKYSK